MKCLYNVPRILVFVSLFVASLAFGADSDVKDIDGMLERHLGPGNLLSGVHEYVTTLRERTLSFEELAGMTGGVASLAVFGLAWQIDDEEYLLSRTALLSTCGALAVYNLSLFYDVIGVIRERQKIRADKPVKDNKIKKYIRILLDDPYFEHDIRFELLKQYRKKEPDWLRECVKEVLIEKKICEKRNDGSGIECIRPFEDHYLSNFLIGELVVVSKIPELRLLYRILKSDEGPKSRVYASQQAVIDDLFNCNRNKNIKGARR